MFLQSFTFAVFKVLNFALHLLCCQAYFDNKRFCLFWMVNPTFTSYLQAHKSGVHVVVTRGVITNSFFSVLIYLNCVRIKPKQIFYDRGFTQSKLQ